MTPIAAHATRPKPGEIANGDRAFFIEAGDAKHVAGVVDGLGHGPKAQEAALRTVETIEANAGASVEELFEVVHRALRGTRGAALTIVTLDGDTIAAGGVGNVALRVLHGPALGYVATPGIVGGQMRGVRVVRARVELTARIVVHSDGISSRFPSEPFEAPPPDQASARLLAEHAGSLDDATVLVLDLTLGRRPASGAPPGPRP